MRLCKLILRVTFNLGSLGSECTSVNVCGLGSFKTLRDAQRALAPGLPFKTGAGNLSVKGKFCLGFFFAGWWGSAFRKGNLTSALGPRAGLTDKVFSFRPLEAVNMASVGTFCLPQTSNCCPDKPLCCPNRSNLNVFFVCLF